MAEPTQKKTKKKGEASALPVLRKAHTWTSPRRDLSNPRALPPLVGPEPGGRRRTTGRRSSSRCLAGYMGDTLFGTWRIVNSITRQPPVCPAKPARLVKGPRDSPWSVVTAKHSVSFPLVVPAYHVFSCLLVSNALQPC